jgi:hypothetical protein
MNKKLTIPQIRAELEEMSMSLNNRRLIELADMLKRNPRNMQSPRKSLKMTTELGDKARDLHEADPTLSQVEIAEQLGINPGRVSEALAGKW